MKIFTVIYYKMPFPCNNLINSIETPISRDPAVSCGILRYPAVIRLTLPFSENYRLADIVLKNAHASGLTKYFMGLVRSQEAVLVDSFGSCTNIDSLRVYTVNCSCFYAVQ